MNIMQATAYDRLVAFVEKMHKHLLSERDCYYEGCSNDEGEVPDADDRDVLAVMDADIEEAERLSRYAKMALRRYTKMTLKAQPSPELPCGPLGDDTDIEELDGDDMWGVYAQGY